MAERLTDVKQLYQRLQASEGAQDDVALQEQKAKLEADLQAIAERKEALNLEIEQIKENKQATTQKVASLRQQLSQETLTEHDLLSERKFESANKTRLEVTLAEKKEEIERLEQFLATTKDDNQLERLPILQKQQEAAQAKKSELDKQLVSQRFELEDCEAQLEELANLMTRENQKNEDLIRQQAILEAQISQVSSRLRQFAQDLSEDYQFTLEDAKQASQAIEDMPRARQCLQDLHRQIKALGPINLDSIEQYQGVKERLTFLNTQKDDLIHSKDLLLGTINDMDDEVKTRFQTTFNAIRESFKLTFRQMFGGGSAELSLTDDNVLTAGVEISVQPPGKKIQSLNLMSGGEKALSALALLFSIIRIKTIPFVILDEVEAALDEANVKRFGDYLNRFDQSSQFIVVTHRKGTMAAADSIYGVTMQESGISRIVSVKLKEAENLVD